MLRGDGSSRRPPSATTRRPPVLLALSSLLLILLAGVALMLRSGTARWQALPALLIGIGLLLTSVSLRRRRRGEMLSALRRQRSG